MSLQVWLPLNGDLHNQGLAGDLSFTAINTLTFTNGKIGKCYQRATNNTQVTTGINIDNNLLDLLGTQASVAMWVKPLGTHTHYNGTLLSSGNWNAKRWTFGVSQDNTKVDVLCGGHNTYIDCPIPIGEWTHLCSTFNNGVSKLYKNGIYIGQLTGRANFDSDATNTCIGRETYASGYFGFNGLINDVRIYDHVLSQKEIEEIAKGLILHYKLDGNGKGNNNILINTHFDNRYSQTTGWDTSKNGTLLASSWGGYNSGVSNQATVYHAHLKEFNGEYVYEYIKTSAETWLGISQGGLQNKLIAGQTYTFSWEEYHTDGTNRVGTGLYYYKSGATSANFHLGIQSDTSITRIIGQWQKYSYTFVAPSDADYSKNISWYIYGHYNGNGTFYMRHPKLELGNSATTWIPHSDDILYPLYSTSIIYDSSGYDNNGQPNQIVTKNNGPRYNINSIFNGTNSYIKVIENKWMPQHTRELTINLWAKATTWPTSGHLFSCTESGGFNTESGNSGYWRFPIYVCTNEAQTSYAYKYDSQEIQLSALPVNEWVMLTFVYDSTGTRTYINGQLHHTYTNVSYGIHFNTNARLFLGCEANTASPSSPYFNGEESDFRIYVTALSSEAILELYHTSATIDNNGNIYSRELVEI